MQQVGSAVLLVQMCFLLLPFLLQLPVISRVINSLTLLLYTAQGFFIYFAAVVVVVV